MYYTVMRKLSRTLYQGQTHSFIGFRAGVHGADEVRTVIENMWDKKLAADVGSVPVMAAAAAVPAVVRHECSARSIRFLR